MALHGDILVNGDRIGWWEAKRKVHPPNPDFNEYAVEVMYYDLRGDLHGLRDVLTHRYGDGSIALVAEVLALAAKKLPPLGEENI